MFAKKRTTVALFLIIAIMLLTRSICCAGEFFNASATSSAREMQDELVRAERALGLQTELPLVASEEAPDARWRLPGISADAAGVVLYGALIAFVVIMLFLAPANLWSFNRSRKVHTVKIGEEGAGGGSAARMARSEHEADELAHMGDYVEAMHMLLLESVSELSLRANMAISESLTSREILHRAALPSEGRAAFADIISRVEVSYYGLYRPGPDDYAACRNSFEMLRTVLVGGQQ